MVGWWASGKLRPTRSESSFALSRCMPDGACRSLQRVCMAGVAVQKPRSQVRPALHPVAAKSLSVALWKVPAVAPSHGVPAGNQSAVRVTSLKEAVPRRMVDVQNTMQSVRGFGIITRNGAIRRLPAFRTVSLPESRNPCRGSGFRLSRATRERKRGAMIRHLSGRYNYASALHIKCSSRRLECTSITASMPYTWPLWLTRSAGVIPGR